MKIRRLLASLASVLGGGILFHEVARGTSHGAEQLFADSLVAIPVIAALLIWARPIAAQLLARATWWSLLLVGGLLAVATDDRDLRTLGAYIAMCNAGALLAVGGLGLGEGQGRFVPVAFRGTLIVSLVLAIADTGSFLWFGLGNAIFEGHLSIIVLVPLMIAGVIGLLRLRTWGLLVSLSTNLLITILAATDVLDLPGPMRTLFITTAIVQLIVPIPMLVALVRGRAPDPQRWSRLKTVVPMAIVAAIAGISIYCAFVQSVTNDW
jgi:hypothetical protein